MNKNWKRNGRVAGNIIICLFFNKYFTFDMNIDHKM